ncbi:hypothetical protein PR048_001839 [Dryococelus australis]|uniref:Vitellogenin n=1 Tax=Dryococelus australis TaxID=614101 RepID=A0ABQ9IIG8_9NEOP|nr:hypothetical protein PR048_001839 [Dryococelus australis]
MTCYRGSQRKLTVVKEWVQDAWLPLERELKPCGQLVVNEPSQAGGMEWCITRCWAGEGAAFTSSRQEFKAVLQAEERREVVLQTRKSSLTYVASQQFIHRPCESCAIHQKCFLTKQNTIVEPVARRFHFGHKERRTVYDLEPRPAVCALNVKLDELDHVVPIEFKYTTNTNSKQD